MKLNIDCHPISLSELRNVWEEDVTISIGEEAKKKIASSMEIISNAVRSDESVYGVNTGVGKLAQTKINNEDLGLLQKNLISSHAVGVGELLPNSIVRLVMVLKVNALAQGYSGVSQKLIEALCNLINHSVYPCVPSKGSVGASGDLAPLAHLSEALLGIGDVHYSGNRIPAKKALADIGQKPLDLQPKEGLALVNGTQVSTAISLAALFRTECLIAGAISAGAMAVDAIKGSDTPFEDSIQQIKGHSGQIAVANLLRKFLMDSEIRASHIECDRVQDPYSIRCQPQIIGACVDVIKHVSDILNIESNAVTDNPLVFSTSGQVLSGGNFHAESVAFVSDYLALAIAETGSLSERQIALLIDENQSGLPPFLVENSGLNSGFMIAQVTAAALVSENKVLSHPASVDSIPTSANQEDHVSMATFAANRLHTMIDNVLYIIAIDLIAAAQGITFHHPQKSSVIIEEFITELRVISPAYNNDRSLSNEITEVAAMIEQGFFNHHCKSILPSYSE